MHAQVYAFFMLKVSGMILVPVYFMVLFYKAYRSRDSVIRFPTNLQK
jgi:succinate dehydrogenase hydrophobic anchor subunit